jgi:hypothetical protein
MACDVASSAADKVDDVDTKDLKNWWPVAAIIGGLVAVGVVGKRKRDKAGTHATRKD